MPRGMDEATRDLTILSLNARGEGVGEDGTIAPGALPGEAVRIEPAGAVEIRGASPSALRLSVPISPAAAAAPPSI